MTDATDYSAPLGGREGSAAGATDATLARRQGGYGAFIENARIIQAIKGALRDSPNWQSLPPDMVEALEMIATKLGRILNGDPEHLDSWHDITGYARLIEARLERESTP